MESDMIWRFLSSGLFAFQVMLVSTAAGVFLYRSPKILKIPGMSRFLTGAAISPYLIGVYTWLMGGIPVKLPSIIYILPPYIISVLVLWRCRSTLRTLCQKIWYRNYSAMESAVIGALICFVLPMSVGLTLFMQGVISRPVIALVGTVLFSVCLYLLSLFFMRSSKLKFKEQSAEQNKATIWALIAMILIAASTAFLLIKIAGVLQMTVFPPMTQILIFVMILCVISISFVVVKICNAFDFEVYCRQFIRLGVPLCFLLFSSFIVLGMTSVSISPLVSADVSQYASEALAFAKTMSWSDANGFLGSQDGSLLANIHSFAWPAYMANALLHKPPGTALGYPNDLSMRLAIALCVPFMIMAIVAAARTFSKKFMPAASVILFFGSVNLNYITMGASRDAYRLIPLILFVCVLMGAEGAARHKPFHIKYYIVPCMIGAFIMMGHPISAVSAVAIVLAFTVYLLSVGRLFSFNTLFLYVSTAIGALIGGFQMIIAFVTTGSLTGGLIDLNVVLLGTPYYNNFMNYSEGRLLDKHTLFERFVHIIFRDSGWINIVGIVVSVVMIALILYKCAHKIKVPKTLFIYAIVFFHFIMILDVFGWSGFSLTEWYVKNYRYTFNLQLFFALGLACALSAGCSRLSYILTQRRNTILNGLYAIGLATVLIFPLTTGIVQWGAPLYSRAKDIVEQNHMETKTIMEATSDKRLLIDNYNYNYYYDNEALSIFTKPAENILRSSTEAALDDALKEHNIGVVSISKNLLRVYWKNTVLLNYLKNSENVRQTIEMPRNTVYILTTSDWRGQSAKEPEQPSK